MGNRTLQSRSFNTVKHSNRDARIKKRQKQRLLILSMMAVIALLLVMLVILAICSMAQAWGKNNDPDILPPSVGTTLAEGTGMTVVSSQYKTRGPLLIVSMNNQGNSYIPDESTMTTIAKNAQPTFNGAYVYKLSNDIKLHPDALAAFNAMMTEYCKILWSGEDEHEESPVTLVEAFRTLTQQENIYNPNKPDSVKPGFSDHHTGYLLNLSASTAAMSWIRENCHKYGFVVRYPSDKSSTTGVTNYDTCIRYVGVAHASYMKANNLCLEEYVALIQQHPWETQLSFTVKNKNTYIANESTYIVYYATAYTAGTGTNLTQITTPRDYAVESVSGDNINGFIVTVKLN